MRWASFLSMMLSVSLVTRFHGGDVALHPGGPVHHHHHMHRLLLLWPLQVSQPPQLQGEFYRSDEVWPGEVKLGTVWEGDVLSADVKVSCSFVVCSQAKEEEGEEGRAEF